MKVVQVHPVVEEPVNPPALWKEVESLQHEPKIMLNISGTRFAITKTLLLKYPHTKLGKLMHLGLEMPSELFFVADADIFAEVMYFYRHGKIYMPKHVNEEKMREELRFWELPEEIITSCVQDKEEAELEKLFQSFDTGIKPNMDWDHALKVRYQVWCVMTDGLGPYTEKKHAGIIYTLCYFLLLIVQISTVALKTSLSHQRENDTTPFINMTENMTAAPTSDDDSASCKLENGNNMPSAFILFCISISISVILNTEFIITTVICPEKSYLKTSILFYASGLTLLAETILIAYLNVARREHQPLNGMDCYQFLMRLQSPLGLAQQTRVIKLISILSQLDGVKVLLLTLKKSWYEIFLLGTALTCACCIFGPAIYLLEVSTAPAEATPLVADIPKGFWFTIVTMTTVGYGDLVPITYAGRMFTVIIMMFGLMLTSLPVAIIGGNFTICYEFHLKRKKNLEQQAIA